MAGHGGAPPAAAKYARNAVKKARASLIPTSAQQRKKRDRNSQTSQNTFGEAPSETDKLDSPPLFPILSNYEQ